MKLRVTDRNWTRTEKLARAKAKEGTDVGQNPPTPHTVKETDP